MILSEGNIIQYARHHLPGALVGKSVVVQNSKRSAIFIVDDSYLFKNLNFNDKAEVSGFRNECEVTKILSGQSKEYVCRLYFTDPHFNIMCVEYFPRSTYFSESFVKGFSRVFDNYTALKLASIHKYVPWVLKGEVNATKNVLISEETLAKIKHLRNLYLTSDFVHGDLKMDNVLIVEGEIKIIDWEFAGAGDKVWDMTYLIASLFIQKAHTELSLVVNTLSENKFTLFFSANQPHLLFIKGMFDSLFYSNRTSGKKFITFLGLSILQRTIEGFEKENFTDRFLLKLGKELAFNPDEYNYLIL